MNTRHQPATGSVPVAPIKFRHWQAGAPESQFELKKRKTDKKEKSNFVGKSLSSLAVGKEEGEDSKTEAADKNRKGGAADSDSSNHTIYPESPGATTKKLTLESLSSMTILVFRIPFVSLFLRSRPITTTLYKQK